MKVISPSAIIQLASSEHMYSLLGKRIVVVSQNNKGKRIDAGAVKMLTGNDDIKCRPWPIERMHKS